MVRKHTSQVPRWARIWLLVPLPVIAGLVFWAGQHPRKGLFESQTLGEAPASATAALSIPVQFPRSGLRLADTVQGYTAENLYEKIDGHDGAFLRFGFQSLTFVSYADSAGRSVDVYLYRLDRRENALGVYASERSDERENIAILDAGYRSGGAVFFYRGPYYVQIIPAESVATDVTGEIVDALCRMISAPTEPLAPLALFPEEASVPNSDGYFPDKAFGTDFVGNVFTRQYHLGNAVVTAFRHQSDTAEAMYARFREFLQQSAQAEPPLKVSDVEVSRYASYGEETWIFTMGEVFGGVMGQITENADKQLIGELIAAFRRGKSGS